MHGMRDEVQREKQVWVENILSIPYCFLGGDRYGRAKGEMR
jgi:hypothetical protein